MDQYDDDALIAMVKKAKQLGVHVPSSIAEYSWKCKSSLSDLNELRELWSETDLIDLESRIRAERNRIIAQRTWIIAVISSIISLIVVLHNVICN